MRPVIPHKVARSGTVNGKGLAGLIGIIFLVALGVWVWGIFNLPALPAILLWWWPSLLAGALAGAAAGVAVETARFVQRAVRGRQAAREVATTQDGASTPLSPAE